MSTFKVTIETISNIEPINGADSIVLADIAGYMYTFIIKKDTFQVGDKCVYIPLDAVLPESLKDKLGLPDNRIKTYKLKKFGVISQGVLASLSIIEGLTPDGDDYASALGIKKYEEPQSEATRFDMNKARQSPVYVYDIESVGNWPENVAELEKHEIVITEKLEGTHLSITYYSNGRVAVCSRKLQVEDENSLYYRTYKQYQDNDDQILKYLRRNNHSSITLRGEIIGPGIQGNYYRLDNTQLYLFEADVDGIPTGYEKFLEIIRQTTFNMVPVLHERESLHKIRAYEASLQDKLWVGTNAEFLINYSNGYSVINPKMLREGIVIRPVEEQFVKGLGRLILKVRSPEYLAAQK